MSEYWIPTELTKPEHGERVKIKRSDGTVCRAIWTGNDPIFPDIDGWLVDVTEEFAKDKMTNASITHWSRL